MPGPEAGGYHQGAERQQQVVGQIGEDRPPLRRIGDGPEGRQQPGMVERELTRPSSSQTYRPATAPRATAASTTRPHRRRRRDRARGPRRDRPWPPRDVPGRRERPQRGSRARRPWRRTTARSEVRAVGRARDAGRSRRSTMTAHDRRCRHRARPGRDPHPARRRGQARHPHWRSLAWRAPGWPRHSRSRRARPAGPPPPPGSRRRCRVTVGHRRMARPTRAAGPAAGSLRHRSRRPAPARSRRSDRRDRRTRPVDRPCRPPAPPADPAGGPRPRPPGRRARRERFAHRQPADRWLRRGSRRSRRRGASGSSPADPSTGCSRPRSASHSAPRPRPAARGTVPWRRRSPDVRAGLEPTSRRTSAPVPWPPRPRLSMSAPSARRSRSSRSSSAISAPTLAGSADDPTRRQVRPSLPMSETETVAAPRSIVANARGSVVTRAC